MSTCFQVSDLIAELASAAAAEKGLAFEEGLEERLCAYSRAVAHFPTAVKEVNLVSFKRMISDIYYIYLSQNTSKYISGIQRKC